MTILRSILLCSLVATASAYQPPKLVTDAAKAAATAALVASLTSPALAASSTAAQISLNTLPPNSISIQIQDLPVVGQAISGTYTRVPDSSISKPSLVIQSPKDKLSAIKSLATTGHLEFDVNGLVSTHLDVDVAADQSGVAQVRVSSGLIPKLPFQNAASNPLPSKVGGKESPWNMVVNLGSGETYYYNEKTGVTQTAHP